MKKAVLGLGSNLGQKMSNLYRAVEALQRVPGTNIVKLSNVYKTYPVGYIEQPVFLNDAVLIETELSPRALLGVCLGIEAAMGRVREFKNGPRCIDIDLLYYEGEKSDDPELILPHPRINERNFVVTTLKDLFPDLNALGFTFREPWKKGEDAVLYKEMRLPV